MKRNITLFFILIFSLYFADVFSEKVLSRDNPSSVDWDSNVESWWYCGQGFVAPDWTCNSVQNHDIEIGHSLHTTMRVNGRYFKVNSLTNKNIGRTFQSVSGGGIDLYYLIQNLATATTTFNVPIAAVYDMYFDAASGDMFFGDSIYMNGKSLKLQGKNITIKGIISDGRAAGYVRVEGASVIFEGVNTHSGTTTIVSGSLKLDKENSISQSSTIFIDGGKLQISKNQEVKNLTLAATAELQVDAGTVLTVKGDFSDAGGTITNNGTIIFEKPLSETANLSLSGSGTLKITHPQKLNELTLGANTLLIEDALTVNKLITTGDIINQGKLQINASTNNAAGNVTLSETASLLVANDAALTINSNLRLIKNFSAASHVYVENGDGVSVTGNVEVLAVCDPDRWHFIGFPFDVSAIKKTNGSDPVYVDDYEIMKYNTEKRSANKSGWESVTAQEQLSADKGYILWATDTLIFEGTMSGNIASQRPMALCNDYENDPTKLECNTGWNLVAHPLFCCSEAIPRAGTVHYKYIGEADSYETNIYYDEYEYNGTGKITSPIPFESYFMKVVSAHNLDFTAVPPGSSFRLARAVNVQNERVNLALKTPNYNYTTQVHINANATADYDKYYDAPHTMAMLLATPQIYTLIGARKYAINAVPETTSVPVGVRVPVAGEYTLTWESELYNQTAVLYDAVEAKSIPLNSDVEYTFTTDKSGEINNRFALNFVPGEITNNPQTNDDNILVSTLPGRIVINGLQENTVIKLYDITGKCVLTETTDADSVELSVTQKGIYILEINKMKLKIICQ